MKKSIRCYICIDNAIRKEIEKEVGCSYNHAYLSLRDQRDGEMAKKVKELALARGGETRIDAPQQDVIVRQEEDPEGSWALTLDNGVIVWFGFGDGNIVLKREGKDIAVYPNPECKSISAIITYAANL